MHRIDNQSAATSLPTPKPLGPEGFFTAGDVNVGQSATIVEFDWLNTIQEELMNIVLKGGLSSDKNTNTQVLQALGAMLTGAYSIVTVTQDIPVPPWATRIEYTLVGGGGGGAYCQSDGTNHRAGAGGGSGGYLEAQRPVTPGQILHCVIGAGGASDTAGTSSSLAFTGQWTASCGGGYPGTYFDPTHGDGGYGGAPSGGDLMSVGNPGENSLGGTQITPANGGPGPWGGGGLSGGGGGGDATGPGGGGGGASDTGASNVHYPGGAGYHGLLKYRFLP
jgi:hypothetical protein